MSSVTETTTPNFKIEQFINPVQLKEDVGFNLANLDNAVVEQAQLFVHYAVLAGQARRQFERLKATFEILESKLYAHHREQLTGEGKKATETMIDAAVKADSRWYQAHSKVIDARQIMDLANDAREAFSMRKDMLIQVTADRRKEAEGEMRIMKAKAVDEASAATRDAVVNMLRKNAA